MRKLITLFFFLLAVVIHAQQITPDEAAAIASEFLNSSSPQLAKSKRVGVRRAKARTNVADNSLQPYYVFNGDDDRGFVIISGDNRARKILGYSDTGNFDFDNLPPQLSAMLDQYAEQIKSLPESAAPDASWSTSTRAASADSDGVLLETANWGQHYPFNMYAPEVDGIKCPSGCVATAMAIVMKYNNWPEKGRGEHKWYSNGTLLDYDFGNVQFDYSLMPDTYEEGEYSEKEAIEVAKLMQAAAAGVNMTYDIYGSGAMTCVVGHSMYEYFRYSPQCQFVSAANFDESSWLKMIYNQIDSDHPVIMSGASETQGGHAFVCDGYNSEDYLHINWGWDGINNGFFSPFVLDGFEYGIGMVINLFNDGCEKEYARCWNDYGYLWATAGNGAGFNVSVENIEKDVPFSAIVGQITFPNDFSGVVCLAVIDENEDIIEVNEQVGHRFEGNHDWDHIGYTWVGHGALSFRNVTFKTNIEDNMRIQAVAREDGGNWKLILGTIEAPSSVKTVQNTPYISTIEWNIHDPYHVTNIEYQNDNQHSVLLGECCPFNLNVRGGVGYAIVDGVYRCNGSDFTAGSFNFVTTKDTYTIDIYANRYEDLLERTVTLEQAGTLSSKILQDERSLIYKLTVEGPMNADDYAFITSKLYSLKHLDVRNTTIEASEYNRYNYLPETAGHNNEAYDKLGHCVWGIESIILPDSLLGFEACSMPHAGIEFLEIPKSVNAYECSSLMGHAGMKLDFLRVNNPTPAPIPEGIGAIAGALDLVYDGVYRNNTVLYVPVGSKEAYAASPSWRGYKDIRESDSDFIGKFTDFDGARYLILSDFAVISGIYEPHGETFVLPSSVEYKGKTYPVTGNCREMGIQYLYLMNTGEFEFNQPYQCIRNAVTPYISADYKCKTGEYMTLWIPGGSSDNYAQMECNVNEMWEYKIDWQHKLLSIVPTQMCSIGEVRINGAKTEPLSENLYRFSDENGLAVDIQFSTFGHEYNMCTNYSNEFNNALSSTNLAKPIERIELNVYQKQVAINETFTIEAKVFPENATDKSIVWSSSDESIAVVDADGNVTSVGVGEAAITATAADGSGVSATCSVTVNPVLAESLILSAMEWSGKIGESFTLSATVLPENATNKNITWSSSDESIAVVDADGNVTSVGVGEAAITATAADGSGVSATCSVTVNPVLAESLTLSATEWSGKIGESFTLSATVLPENATDKTVVWSSGDESIAMVDTEGNIVARAVGEATITASCGSVTANCTVTVAATPAESVTLSQTTAQLKAGESVRLTATVSPATATDKTVNWSSSNSEIATVDANGNVTAISIGEVTITASCGSVTANCTVTVVATPTESVALSQTTAQIKVGKSVRLTATVYPETATDKTVNWSSSNSEIATVDSNGNI
ncbi:MAG: Ig-like domain-containing protein, partial [Bacteroidaceae bacterium]|nr:Ig-like domain-containing protein [Bacteroidaceae bacterium]